MTNYKLYKDEQSGKLLSIFKIEDNQIVMSLPFDPANTDYQAYLKWVAEGNEPLPAENE
jgi:hypothetical protein